MCSQSTTQRRRLRQSQKVQGSDWSWGLCDYPCPKKCQWAILSGGSHFKRLHFRLGTFKIVAFPSYYNNLKASPTFYLVIHCIKLVIEFFIVPDNKSLEVHHYKPTLRSREHGKYWEDYNYTEENDQVRLQGRNRGVGRFRNQPRLQTLDYECIHFGFTKLTKSGGFFPEIKRQLRSYGVIDAAPIKRKWKVNCDCINFFL